MLYCSWSHARTLREERRLRVSENRILRRIFGPKRDENGEWRRLHNEELHTGKLTGKRPLGRPRRTWNNNVKMDLK